MEILQFKIPIFNFSVSVIYTENHTDSEVKETLKYIKRLSDNKDAYNDIEHDLEGCFVNGGICILDPDRKTLVISLNPVSSKKDLNIIFNHEKRHLVDKLTHLLGIEDTETNAYLDGYVSEQCYTFINNLKIYK